MRECFRVSLFKKCTALQLICSVVLVSGIQQNDSMIHVHIFILIQVIRILNRVLCAMQQVLVGYLIYSSVCIFISSSKGINPVDEDFNLMILSFSKGHTSIYHYIRNQASIYEFGRDINIHSLEFPHYGLYFFCKSKINI